MSIYDVIQVLGVDDYILLDDIVIKPRIFKVVMTILFVSCFLWSLVGNLRTLIAIIAQRLVQLFQM